MIKRIYLIIALIAVVLLSTLSGCLNSVESKTEPSFNSKTSNVTEQNDNTIPFSETIYEAENGILNGTEKNSQGSGYSGDGYVTGFDADGDFIEVEINAPSKGLYNLIIGYRSTSDNKTSNLYINNESAGDIILKKSFDFTELDAFKVMLNEGSNSIKIMKGWGWYDIDYFKLMSVSPASNFDIPKTLVNPSATEEAKALMSFLVDNYGKGIISGQQDYKYIAWIERNTGKKPALLGLDFIDYSPSRVEFGATSKETESY